MSQLSSRGKGLRPFAASWTQLFNAMPVAVWLVASTTGTAADARLNEADDEKNMFSPPENARQAPGFTAGPGQRGGRHSADDAPGWQQIRMIPSLSPQQRAQIYTIYLNARKDMAPVQAQLVTLREQQGQFGGRGQRGAAFREGDAGFRAGADGRFREAGAGFREAGGGCRRGPGGPGGAQSPGPAPGFADSEAIGPANGGPVLGLAPEGPPGFGRGGLPGPRGMGRPPMIDPAVRAQMRDLRDRIRSKRQETWQKVQLVLTQQQRTELEQMRKGELMTANFGNH